MAASVLVDSGFLVALLRRRDAHHRWASAKALDHPPPWRTCEAVLSEAYFLLGAAGAGVLSDLVRREAVSTTFSFAANREPVLALIRRYANVPMSFADACVVRMTEIADDPLLLTTDSDFHVYRRHGRKVIPCAMPG